MDGGGGAGRAISQRVVLAARPCEHLAVERSAVLLSKTDRREVIEHFSWWREELPPAPSPRSRVRLEPQPFPTGSRTLAEGLACRWFHDGC